MSVERNLLISLLKLTKNGPALTELVKTEAHLPTAAMDRLLGKMQNEGLVYLGQGTVEVQSESRLKLAVQAIALGADVENVGNMLQWQEFEAITAHAIRSDGYTVKNNVRFKQSGRRWEIDVVGCKKPLVICIDCKHWGHTIASSALKRIVDAQIDRTRALADNLPNPTLKLECTQWNEAKFMPAVLSLMPSPFKFYARVPIVPILQLRDFLSPLPAYTEEMRLYTKSFSSLRQNLQDGSFRQP